VLLFFRNIQFTTAIVLSIYVVLLRIVAFQGWLPVSSVELSAGGVLYEKWFGGIGSDSIWSVILAGVFVFGQAVVVNYVADESRLMNNRDWLPGLFYVVVASVIPDFWFLSPPLVAASVLPLVLRRVFQTYRTPQANLFIFDAALWLVLGSLFYPPLIWLLVAGFAGITILRSFRFREQVVYLTGALVPLFLSWLGWFWFDAGGFFGQKQAGQLLDIYHFAPTFSTAKLLKIGVLCFLFFIVLINYGAYQHKKLIQIQKNIAALYWFMIIGALVVVLQENPGMDHFMITAMPLAIMLAMTFQQVRNRFVAELLFLALLGTMALAAVYPILN
jgi:hypothetical protein